METREITRSLKCPLTDAEIEAGGRELARKIGQLAQLEDEKRAAMSQYKSDIDRITSDIRSLGLKVANGYEFRDITCVIEYDFDRKQVIITRTDLGTIVEERTMTPQEAQMALELRPPADAPVEPVAQKDGEQG